MNTIYLLNGWACNETVLTPLQQQLTANASCSILNLHDYHRPSLAQSLQYLERTIPAQSLVIGWSLGGMLAVQLASQHPLKAIICLGSSPRFVANDTWPDAMPHEQFSLFYQNTLTKPEHNLRHFARLCAQGDTTLRAQSANWIDTNLSHEAQIWGLNLLGSLDNSALLTQLKLPQLHLFADQDALIAASTLEQLTQHSGTISYHRLTAASHAFPFSHAASVADLIQSFILSI